MEKELVTIEFRYMDTPESENSSGYKTKTITIGVFDTLDEAIEAGNKALEIFEKHFKLNIHWNRHERFGKHNGCFNRPNRLITPLSWIQCPFDFYANIQNMKYEDVEETILGVLEARKRYVEYKKNEENDND